MMSHTKAYITTFYGSVMNLKWVSKYYNKLLLTLFDQISQRIVRILRLRYHVHGITTTSSDFSIGRFLRMGL